MQLWWLYIHYSLQRRYSCIIDTHPVPKSPKCNGNGAVIKALESNLWSW